MPPARRHPTGRGAVNPEHILPSAEHILDQLTSSFSDLSPRLQQVARHIVKSPEDVALLTMRGLALQLDVPASTMVRLAQALGFVSYEKFRKPFEQAMRNRGEGFADRAQWLQHLAGNNQTGQIVSTVAEAAMLNLETAFTNLSVDDISRAAQLIAQAKTVYVSGFGAMQFTSGYFYFVAKMALPNMVFADPVEGRNFDDLCEMGDGDVLLQTAFSPYATPSINAMEFALSRNASLVSITDSPVSPIARHADVALIVPTESPQFFPSQSAVIAVLETLIAVLVANGGENTIERIEKIVEFRNERGIYWQPKTNK